MRFRGPNAARQPKPPQAALVVLSAATLLLLAYSVFSWIPVRHQGWGPLVGYQHGWPLIYLVRWEERLSSWRLWDSVHHFVPSHFLANLGVVAGVFLVGYLVLTFHVRQVERFWQFTMKELMVGGLVLVCLASAFAWYLRDVREERRAVEKLEATGWEVFEQAKPEWIVRPLRHSGMREWSFPNQLWRATVVNYPNDSEHLPSPGSSDRRRRTSAEMLAEAGPWISQLRYCRLVDIYAPDEEGLIVTDQGIMALVPHLRRVTGFGITSDSVTDEAVFAIARSCPYLEEASLNIRISDRGIDALQELPRLSRLSLYSGCGVSPTGRRRLLELPRLRELRGPQCWDRDGGFVNGLREAGIRWLPSRWDCECDAPEQAVWNTSGVELRAGRWVLSRE